jgi:hypothetical protein
MPNGTVGSTVVGSHSGGAGQAGAALFAPARRVAVSGVAVISVPPVDGGLAGLTGIRRRRHRSADKFCETQRMAPTDDEKWLVVDGRRWRRTDPAIPADALARLKSHLRRGGNGVRTARNDGELDATRHRTQRAKVGRGELGTPWWEQSDTERRGRWEFALAELDALDDSGRQDQER